MSQSVCFINRIRNCNSMLLKSIDQENNNIKNLWTIIEMEELAHVASGLLATYRPMKKGTCLLCLVPSGQILPQ